MWSIVCFEIDNSVDFVPNFWIYKGVCAWPKIRANVRSYIEKRIDPNDKPDAFSFYNARIIYQDIAEIEEARLKAIKAQDTSGLSQTTTENITENRNILSTHQKRYSNSKNTKAPSPPIFNYCDEFEGDDSDVDKTYCPIPKKKMFEELLLPQHYQSQSDEIIHSTPINSQLPDTNNKKIKLQPIDELPSTSKTFSGKELCNDQNQFKDFQKLINRQHIVLKHEVKNMQDRLDIIISIQCVHTF